MCTLSTSSKTPFFLTWKQQPASQIECQKKVKLQYDLAFYLCPRSDVALKTAISRCEKCLAMQLTPLKITKRTFFFGISSSLPPVRCLNICATTMRVMKPETEESAPGARLSKREKVSICRTKMPQCCISIACVHRMLLRILCFKD